MTATSEEEVAQDFLGFFKNFQEIFGISNFKIYVTGESYAGRYVPYVSAAMLDTNDTTHFDLSGALMYDPVIGKFDYVGQTVPAVPFIEKNAQFFNFNETFMKTLHKAHEECGYADYIDKYMQFPPPGNQPALHTWYNNVSASCDVYNIAHLAAFRPNPCFNVYEISNQCPFLFDPLSFPTDVAYNYPGFDGPYFNRSDVKAAMHAPQDVSWSECSGPVFDPSSSNPGEYGDYDLSLDPIQKVLPQVIERTNRVLIGNGDYDYEILSEGTLLSIQNMTWNGHLGFRSAPCDPVDILLPDLQWQDALSASGFGGLDGPGQGIMGTQHYERGKWISTLEWRSCIDVPAGLMFTTVSQSGHMIPQFQPRVSYRHMQWLLGRIDSL